MFIQKQAPNFEAEALMPDGSFNKISLNNFKNKNYVLLFFYPLDFTFVCPSEILAFSKRVKTFREKNCEIIGISIDSKYTHKAWVDTPLNQGGVGKIEFPLISDLDKNISRNYNVLINEAIALRATFLIDKTSIVRHSSINDLPIGRNVDEYIRLLDALQYIEKYGEVCPAGWSKGKEAIKTTSSGIKEYLTKNINNL